MYARADLPSLPSFSFPLPLFPLASVIPPKVFEFRPTPDSSTTSPSPASFSSPHTAASASLLSPRSLPAHVSILGTNGEDDGEILEDEMKDLKNGKGGKRRSASVFRCESCSKVSFSKLETDGRRRARVGG